MSEVIKLPKKYEVFVIKNVLLVYDMKQKRKVIELDLNTIPTKTEVPRGLRKILRIFNDVRIKNENAKLTDIFNLKPYEVVNI